MRALISLITRSAIIRSRSVSSSPARNAADSPMDRSQIDGDAPPADRDGQRRRLQAGAVAGRARDLAHVGLDLLPAPVALGVGVAPLQERDDALVAGRVLAAAAVAVLVLDRDLTLGAVQQHVLLRLGELPPRLGHVDVVGVGHGLQHPAEVLGAGGAPRTDGAFAHRQVRVGHDQLRVDLEGRAQAVALHAGAVRGVEREVPGRQLLVRLAAHRAGQVLAEGQRVALDLDPRRPRAARSRSPPRPRPASARSPPSRSGGARCPRGARGGRPRPRWCAARSGPGARRPSGTRRCRPCHRRSGPGRSPAPTGPPAASRTRPCAPAPPAPAPGTGCPRAARPAGPRSAAGSGAPAGRRAPGSAGWPMRAHRRRR